MILIILIILFSWFEEETKIFFQKKIKNSRKTVKINIFFDILVRIFILEINDLFIKCVLTIVGIRNSNKNISYENLKIEWQGISFICTHKGNWKWNKTEGKKKNIYAPTYKKKLVLRW